MLWCTKDVAITLDPPHACECGLEDQSGKEDTSGSDGKTSKSSDGSAEY